MNSPTAFRRRPTDDELEESMRLTEQLIGALGEHSRAETEQLLSTPATMIDGRRRRLGEWEVDDFADLHDELHRRADPAWRHPLADIR